MSGVALTVVSIVIAAVITGLLGFIGRQLAELRADMAVIRDHLLPPGRPALRETVAKHTTQLAVIRDHLRIGGTP